MATSEEFFVRRIVLLWSSAKPRIMCTPFSASRAHKHVAKTVELLKSRSSRWVKAEGVEKFLWQRAYGCFSVGQSQMQELIRDIKNQAEHHRKVTFQEEFRLFLRRYEISIDERY